MVSVTFVVTGHDKRAPEFPGRSIDRSGNTGETPTFAVMEMNRGSKRGRGTRID